MLLFSSAIIARLPGDKREMAALRGRIALGCLIVQDLVVLVMASMSRGAAGDVPGRHAPYWSRARGLFCWSGWRCHACRRVEGVTGHDERRWMRWNGSRIFFV